MPVFTEAADRWEPIATIQLPLDFDDYAGVAVAGERIAVISQESSALWLGRLDPRTWTVDDGVVHDFPRDDDGKPRFATVEGVSFLGLHQVVVATDRTSGRRHTTAEQSVAVFDLPTILPRPGGAARTRPARRRRAAGG